MEHVRQKQEKKAQELKDYMEYSETKIKKHIIYTFMQSYMSVIYTGLPAVRWSGDGGRIQEKAENLNQVAEFDYKEMGQWIWESIFFGLDVRMQDGFDVRTRTPIFKNISALSIVADPYFTDFNISGHRYFGFDMEVTMYEMRQKAWKNIDLVSKKGFNNEESYRNHVEQYRSYEQKE